jgi:hypothetical protein
MIAFGGCRGPEVSRAVDQHVLKQGVVDGCQNSSLRDFVLPTMRHQSLVQRGFAEKSGGCTRA